MKTLARLVALVALISGSGQVASIAQTTPPKEPAAGEKSPAAAELQELVTKIRGKIREGKRTEADLAEEMKTFDALLKKYSAEKSEDAANILFMKGTLYVQVFQDMQKGKAILQQVKTDYPGTRRAAVIDQVLAQIESQAAGERAKAALVGKPAPELNFIWSSREGLTKLSDLKGKVVVLDFWATWCGPCVASFPEIKDLASHYKGYDVEVIGVTSIQGRVSGLEEKPIDVKGDEAKELKLMADYIKAKDITWTIAFSKEEVFNPAYGVSGIPHMAIIGPDGKVMHNGIHPGATPLKEKTAMIDKLLKDANLKVPPAS